MQHNNIKKYYGDLIGGGLLPAESRVIAELLLEKLSDDELNKLIVDENILQKNSVNTAMRITSTVRRRLEPMGDAFTAALLVAPESVYTQMLMLSLLVNSPIVADFMRLPLAETRRVFKPVLSADAWGAFIEDQMRAMPELVKYSEESIGKMGRNAIKALAECGYLNTREERRIQSVYLLPDVKRWIIELKHEELLEVMECTV